MNNRILTVRAEPAGFVLHVEWADARTSTHDFRQRFNRFPALAGLAESDRFVGVRVGEDGATLEWPESGVDVCADSLRFEAYPEENPFPDVVMAGDEFRAWMKGNSLSLSAAAGILGISRRQIANFANGTKPVPCSVFLSCMSINQRSPAARVA